MNNTGPDLGLRKGCLDAKLNLVTYFVARTMWGRR